ncbi:hypothetical protein M427DRAFT_55011 [Gonapodya prolifera JEL478]|uniref:Uncharacterized protein n=1 Tax=Gonapodya prolifera (strain JEL478) TaxID=1344416 RepID=A0A139AKN0_GONPJ|nr:hypothetical protein M427DRAFT_55011 [Gonapodya prolifera JEL478]|eukprot:KXS16985.1 hypothetical protein M427DRAFT_55011 [Gonapodya prolifera JEL478]
MLPLRLSPSPLSTRRPPTNTFTEPQPKSIHPSPPPSSHPPPLQAYSPNGSDAYKRGLMNAREAVASEIAGSTC